MIIRFICVHPEPFFSSHSILFLFHHVHKERSLIVDSNFHSLLAFFFCLHFEKKQGIFETILCFPLKVSTILNWVSHTWLVKINLDFVSLNLAELKESMPKVPKEIVEKRFCFDLLV